MNLAFISPIFFPTLHLPLMLLPLIFLHVCLILHSGSIYDDYQPVERSWEHQIKPV